jgi:hypothetical protein
LLGPRGERNGKALSGADSVCEVANPQKKLPPENGSNYFEGIILLWTYFALPRLKPKPI